MHGNKTHMLMVWKFYCGLVRSGVGHKFVSILKETKGRSLFHFQCAYESQDSVACDHVLESTGGQLTIADQFLKTPDLTAIGFVAAKPQIPLEITILYCNISVEPINSVYYPNIVKISLLQLDLMPASLASVLHFCQNLQELKISDTLKRPGNFC